ncbi:hypothetical protein D7V97_38680 [Corallococcus sp. CA053C]|uniref:hypothetical protein n=1 Tax=Corallococcus sp. CA053C TaxID=2316732 RepID=UPI000EE8E161|nr:hypothetical protein [Corallococcus sp. CA053C]RKG94554.1 hypothetical protein D7V97_38680 [Corallococcus sp. CA053C]
MMSHVNRLPSLIVSLLLVVGFALPASADTFTTYATPKVNGYQIGTVYPNAGTSSAPDTARRFCQDLGHTGAQSQTTSIRGSAYTYIVGSGGIGNWNTTGNSNVTMIESVTCVTSTSDVTYAVPKVNGYQVGTLQPNDPASNFSTAADTARRFCQDQGHAGARSFTTSIRGSAYTYIVGANGVGNWNTTGNANVTMLESITCFNSTPDLTYPNPKVNGYQVGTLHPVSGFSSAADTARRFCQDLGHSGASTYVPSVRSVAYSFINGTNGIGNWSITGNSNVTMLDSITCTP